MQYELIIIYTSGKALPARPGHGSGGWSSASEGRDPGSIPSQSTSWTKWHYDRFSSDSPSISVFPVNSFTSATYLFWIFRCIIPVVFYLQIIRVYFESKQSYLMLFLYLSRRHVSVLALGHLQVTRYMRRLYSANHYESHYFIYDSHCIVSSVVYLVTWRWPSARAETCRQLK